jgi:hypothetical protein
MTIKKLVPETIMAKGKNGAYQVCDVIRVESFPPGGHPEGCPIIKEAVAVRIQAENGGVRWYGAKAARITSGLRMEMELWPGGEGDEVVMKWENSNEI